MSKKVISLLLAIMLTVSMVAVAAVSVSAEVDEENRYYPTEGTDTYRYYFYMPSDWYNDYAYTAGIYWWQGTDACPAWPGYYAQPGDIENVYYADVPTDVTTIIWNNGFDGGEDPTSEEYALAIQTMNIGSEYYDEGESDLYPAGTESFDNMIYVIDPNKIDVNDFNGKMTCGGEWYYYYGNGEYGVQPTREEAVAADALYNTDYQPPKPGTEPTEPATDAEDVTVPATDAETTPDPTEPVTDPVVTAPYLTVNATSNYFPEATAEYNAETNEVTVTYWMQSSKDLLDTQWYLSYDSEVLSVSKKNTPATICPAIGTSAVLNLRGLENKIKYNATNLYLFDFSKETAFAQVVFDVKDISASAPVTTTVDLDVDVLRVSSIDPDTFMTDSNEEVVLVNNSEVTADTTVTVARRTTLTESTYVEPTTVKPVETEPVTTKPVETEPATTEPVTTVPVTEPSDVLYLTVNATSNYFPEATAEYNPTTNEVTVTYWLQSDKDVLDTQWYMTYDSEVLSLSEKNTPATICPTMADVAVLNLDRENTIYFNATNLNLFDFTTEAPFAQVVFDVNDISASAPVTTTVDLTVEVLRVSEINEDTLMTDSSKEEILVNNTKVEDTAVATNRRTTLTESTYVEPTTAPVDTEPVTTVPVDTEPVTTVPVDTEPATTVPAETEPVETEPTPTDPVETEPVETDPATTDEVPTVPAETPTDATSATGATSTTGSSSNNNASNNGTVQTGDASLAVIILTLLVVATGVMLALRKREMF